MNKYLIALLLALAPAPAFAAWNDINNSDLFVADTEAEVPDVICLEDHFIYAIDTHNLFFSIGCNPIDPSADGTYLKLTPPTLPMAMSNITGLTAALAAVPTLPIGMSDVTGLTAALASVATLPITESNVTNLVSDLSGKVPTSRTINGVDLSANRTFTFDAFSDGTTNKAFTGTMLTKLNGIATGATANSSDATLESRANHTGTQLAATISDFTSAVKIAVGTRTFNYPGRTLAGCFQVSSTNDADVNYSVDISAAISLGGGTGVLTSYTNSGCSTGAQIVSNGSVSSVALGGTSSIPLHTIAKANTWLKVTGTASGGGSAAIDAVQSETVLP